MRMKLTEVKKLTSVWFRFSLLIINSINENLHCSNFFFVWVFHFLMPSSSLDSNNSSSDHYWIKSNLTFDCVCFFLDLFLLNLCHLFFFLCPFLIPPIILNFISQFFFFLVHFILYFQWSWKYISISEYLTSVFIS